MNKDEFSRLVRENERSMYALAWSVVKNEADACDAVSESILRAYSNLDTLRNVHAFKAWILRIVHNTAVELIRRSGNVLDIDGLGEDEPAAEGMDHAARLVLRDAVEKLPRLYRTAVILFYYEGLSTAKIARIMDIPPSTVRQHLFRARKLLKEHLNREDFYA